MSNHSSVEDYGQTATDMNFRCTDLQICRKSKRLIARDKFCADISPLAIYRYKAVTSNVHGPAVLQSRASAASKADRRIYNGSAGHDAILKRKLARDRRTLCHVMCNYSGHVMVVGDGQDDDGSDEWRRQFVLLYAAKFFIYGCYCRS